MTPSEQLQFFRDRLGMCLDNMEGADLGEFWRWEKLANAYQVIVDDIEEEMAGKFGPAPTKPR